MTTEKIAALEAAYKNLIEHQGQLDMDGIMVAVSRQALDEVLPLARAHLEQLRRGDDVLAAYEHAVTVADSLIERAYGTDKQNKWEDAIAEISAAKTKGANNG